MFWQLHRTTPPPREQAHPWQAPGSPVLAFRWIFFFII
jgi:hypothetical protein